LVHKPQLATHACYGVTIGDCAGAFFQSTHSMPRRPIKTPYKRVF
jgi:hypothetical protein